MEPPDEKLPNRRGRMALQISRDELPAASGRGPGTVIGELHYHDEDALLERLSNGIKRQNREVVFLVGAPLSCPPEQGVPGVPGVEGIIDLIRAEFSADAA